MADPTDDGLMSEGFKIGIYPEMADDEYHDDPCDGIPALSKTIATALVNYSPAHACLAHPLLGAGHVPPSKAMDDGDIMHATLLGYADQRIHVMRSTHNDEPVRDFRSTVARAERDAARAAGKVPMFAHQTERFTNAARKIAPQMHAAGFPLRLGLVEAPVFWVEIASDGTPVQCKSKLDHFRPDVGIIDELKSTRDARPGAKLASEMYRLGYDIQDAAYRRAIASVMPEWAGRVAFRFWFFEIDDPCPVVPVDLDGRFRALGEARWRQAVDMWAHCLNTDTWPGYVDPGTTVRVGPPRWAEEDFEGDEWSEAV